MAALVALAAALRFYGIGHQGFWFDEANTAQLVRFSPGKMLGLIPESESTPPLYYCVAWVWARVFGHGEVGLRSLSALCGMLAVPVAYLAGDAAPGPSRRPDRRRVDRLQSAAHLVLPGGPLLFHARARNRACRCWPSSSPGSTGARRLGLWVVSCALALATHYFAVVAVAPQAVWLLVEHRRSRAVRWAVAVVALCGLALIPLAISQNGTGHDSWIASAALGMRLRQIVPQFMIGTGAPARTRAARRRDRARGHRARAAWQPTDPRPCAAGRGWPAAWRWPASSSACS